MTTTTIAASNFQLNTYLIYLPVILLITWYVAHTLFKNGRVFMLDIFHGKEEIAFATNRLFEVGFYLLNIGFALRIMRVEYPIDDAQTMMEILSSKIGGFSIYLGVMLFFNLYMFFRGRKASRRNAAVSAYPEPGYPDPDVQ